MTTLGAPQTLQGWMDDLDRRVYNIEQSMTSASGPAGNNTFDDIYINDPANPGDPHPISIVSDPVDTFLGSWSSYFDRIYADVSWTGPASGTAASFVIEYAKKNGDGSYQLIDARPALGNGIRIWDLDANTTYGFRIFGINSIGISSTPYPSTGFLDLVVTGDSSSPSQPTGLSVSATIKGVVADWNDNPELDVKFGKGTYRIQIASDAGFTTIVADDYQSARVYGRSDLTPNATYWIRVYAIDSSGNASSPTASATFTTGQVDNAAIADFAVDNAKIASLSAAKVTFGVMAGDRIDVNTLDAATLKTSSLTSGNITLAGGSLIAGSPPTTGLLINSQGLRLYAGGVATVILDAATGSGTFAGTLSSATGSIGNLTVGGVLTIGSGGKIRTAASGVRWEMSSAVANQIVGYTAIPQETNPGFIGLVGVSGSFGELLLQGPQVNAAAAPTVTMIQQVSGGASNIDIGATTINLNGNIVVPGPKTVTIGTVTNATPMALHGALTIGDSTVMQTSAIYGQWNITYTTLQTAWNNMGLVISSGNSNVRAGVGAWANSTAIGWRLDTSVGAGWQSTDAAGTSYAPIYASAYNPSSLRYKLDPLPANTETLSDAINRLEVISYNKPPLAQPKGFKRGLIHRLNEDHEFLGLAAESVAEVLPQAVAWKQLEGDTAVPEAIDYSAIVVAVIAALQVDRAFRKTVMNRLTALESAAKVVPVPPIK